MKRVHANHHPGQRHIRIEIDETEIYGLLDELNPAPDACEFAQPLIELLREARDDFRRGTRPQPRTRTTT